MHAFEALGLLCSTVSRRDCMPVQLAVCQHASHGQLYDIACWATVHPRSYAGRLSLAETMASVHQLIQPIRAERYTGNTQLFMPFTGAPARDILRYLSEDVSDATALFLGCGDASCLLGSMAVEHPGLKQLLALLNDHNASMLARAALLLYMAAELDPDSKDDMGVLWEVWYCSTWGPNTWPRVKPFVERLAQGSVPWLTPLRPEDAAALQRVWGWWLQQKHKKSTARVPQRDATLTAKLQSVGATRSGLAAKSSEYESQKLEKIVQMMVKLGSLDTLLHVLGMKYKQLEDVFKKDMAAWFQAGTLAPGYTGQTPSRAHTANITFMQPGDDKWRCLNFHQPFDSLSPFTASELESAFKSGSSAGVLARACIARITQLVRSFQAHTEVESMTALDTVGYGSGSRNKVHLNVQLVCMDALQLCLCMPLSTPTSKMPSMPLSANTVVVPKDIAASPVVGVPPLLFHAIDTSTLLDFVGLLALLVAAAPRLAPGGHLYTSSHHWHQKKCETLLQFLTEQALCMPLSLTPTILGVRLLTDLSEDRPETPDAQDYIYRFDGFRELVWSPIPAELLASPLPQLQPQVLGGPEGSIEAILKTVAEQLCCVKEHFDAHSNHGLVCGTPQLLAWLLASMIQRVDMSVLLDSSSNDSRGTATISSRVDCTQWLQAWLLTCMMQRAAIAGLLDSNSSNGSRMEDQTAGTRWLLPWLLASLVEQVDMSALLDSISGEDNSPVFSNDGVVRGTADDNSSSGTNRTQEASLQASYVMTHRLLCALRSKVAPMLPGMFRLCFKAGIDILRSSLQQNAPQSWLPADVPACPGLVQLDIAVPQVPQDAAVYTLALRPMLVDDFCRAHKILAIQERSGTFTILQQEDHSKVAQPTAVDYDAKGVHLADCFSMEASAKISLFLPADHGLNLQHVKAVIVGLQPNPTERVDLRPSKPRLVTAPRTPAQVLLPAACSAALRQQEQEGRTAPGHSLVLLVKSMTEDAHSYHAVLQLQRLSADHSVSVEQVTPADVHVQLMDEKHHRDWCGYSMMGTAIAWQYLPETICSTSQMLQVSLKQAPGVQPCKLVLPWPVAAGMKETDIVGVGCYSSGYGIEFTLDAQAQQVVLHLRKAKAWELWPGDEHWPGAAKPLDLGKLPPVSGKAARSLIQECFNVERSLDAIIKRLGSSPESGVPASDSEAEMINNMMYFMSVRDIVHNLMQFAADTPDGDAVVSFQLRDKQEKGPFKLDTGELIVFAVTPLLMTQAGRPVLPVTVLDVSMHRAAGMIEEDEILPGCVSQTKVTPEELHLLRRMLLRNAAACLPTAKQESALPANEIPYCYRSYISFLHPHRAFTQLYSAHTAQPPQEEPHKRLSKGAECIKNRLEELLNTTSHGSEDVAAETRQLMDLPDASQLPPELSAKAHIWLLFYEAAKQAIASCDSGSHDATVTNAGASASAPAVSVAASSTDNTEVCARCHRRDRKLQWCAKCKTVCYCSRECQVADWKQHKTVCRG